MPQSFLEWAEANGEHSATRLGPWLVGHPEETQSMREALELGYSPKQMGRFMESIGGPKVHPDTLRRALTDER